jgi:2-keto-3-deoxy-L-rhamnonate aldolase RhmA
MTMEAVQKFRDNMRAGNVCIGPAISFTDPLVTDAMGLCSDFIWVEMEHGGMSPEVLNGHLMAARVRGLASIVRLPGGGSARIKPVLDSGADGILIPQVRSVQEVNQLVDDCRYPPLGHRGFGPRVPSNYFLDANRNFAIEANKGVFVAVMIETLEAYEAIDEIVNVSGLDSIVIGPADLSWALGAEGNVDDPRVVKAMDVIIARARAAGIFVGCGMGADPVFAARMAQRGAQWLQVGVDCMVLIQGYQTIRAAYHQLSEDNL